MGRLKEMGKEKAGRVWRSCRVIECADEYEDTEKRAESHDAQHYFSEMRFVLAQFSTFCEYNHKKDGVFGAGGVYCYSPGTMLCLLRAFHDAGLCLFDLNASVNRKSEASGT